jgi:hypothetical protein
MIQNFWSEDLNGKDHSGDLGVDGKVILLRKLGGKVWT